MVTYVDDFMRKAAFVQNQNPQIKKKLRKVLVISIAKITINFFEMFFQKL